MDEYKEILKRLDALGDFVRSTMKGEPAPPEAPLGVGDELAWGEERFTIIAYHEDQNACWVISQDSGRLSIASHILSTRRTTLAEIRAGDVVRHKGRELCAVYGVDGNRYGVRSLIDWTVPDEKARVWGYTARHHIALVARGGNHEEA